MSIYCIKLSKNPTFHTHSKHIDIKYHFFCELVQKGEISLEYVQTNQKVENILPNPLPKGNLKMFKERLGLIGSTLSQRGSAHFLPFLAQQY